jgi:hypothetical protein
MNHGNVEAALTLLRNHLAAGHMVVLATTELVPDGHIFQGFYSVSDLETHALAYIDQPVRVVRYLSFEEAQPHLIETWSWEAGPGRYLFYELESD